MKGKAVVTGGATGIGRSIALRLARDGYEIWLVDSDAHKGRETEGAIRGIGYDCTFIDSDVTDWQSVRCVFDQVQIRGGERAILINNAGARSGAGLFEETETTWAELIAVMLTGTFSFSQEFMLRVRNSGAVGSICNIGSIVSDLASDQSPAYHAAKAGVAGLTKYLAVAVGKTGAQIRVNSVEPGLIVQDRHLGEYGAESNLEWRTMCEKYQPSGVVGREQDVANAVAWLCSDEASYINGAMLRIDGGASVQDQFTLAKSFNAKLLE